MSQPPAAQLRTEPAPHLRQQLLRRRDASETAGNGFGDHMLQMGNILKSGKKKIHAFRIRRTLQKKW